MSKESYSDAANRFLGKLGYVILGVLLVPLGFFLWLVCRSLYYFAYEYR